ncbi:MAG: hypothetical protein IAG10_29410 [Planctomycetaceae bacterium]|nr:hypothetical protein [Planctomycetaceae bacterium]
MARQFITAFDSSAYWSVQFREKMPEAITRLMDRVASGSVGSRNAISIRERLKQIRELFRFSRYRPATDGKHTIDDDLANAGGKPEGGKGGAGSSRGGGKSGGTGGRAGDLYSLFAATDGTPADEVGGFSDPGVSWVSLKDGTRTKDLLEDRAAVYIPHKHIIQANADFRVFIDMINRWKTFYSHVPSAGTMVESAVKEWFEQQLIETVLGALALRKSGNWSEQEVEKLWSEESLTSAVLPRYHVDLAIKRALGSKLGTLKDKDVA